MIYSSVIQIDKQTQEFSSVDHRSYAKGKLFEGILNKIREEVPTVIEENYIPYKRVTELRLDLVVYSKEEFGYKMEMLRNRISDLPPGTQASILDVFKNDTYHKPKLDKYNKTYI